MAFAQFPTQAHKLPKFNAYHGTSYTKHHVARLLAAHNIGFNYEPDEDLYICPQCDQAFQSIQQVKDEHVCGDEHDFFYDDLIYLRDHPELFKEKYTPKPVPEKTYTPVMFGNFEVLVEGTFTLPEPKKEEPNKEETLTSYEEMIRDVIESYAAKVGYEEAQRDLIAMGLEEDPVVVKKRERRQAKRRRQRQDKRFVAHPEPYIVSKISIGGGVQPSSMTFDDLPKGVAQATSRKTPRMKAPKKVRMNTIQLENFVKQVQKCISMNDLHFTIIGEKDRRNKLTGKTRTIQGYKRIKVDTIHETGRKAQRDIRMSPFQVQILKVFAHATAWNARIDADKITYGDSGTVLNPNTTRGKMGSSRNEIFIVRGRSDGVLIDAQCKVTYYLRHCMQYYSSTPEKFWKPFVETFVQNIPKEKTHVCSSDVSVEDCGTVAALVTQTVFQMGKITCKTCMQDYANLATQDIQVHLNREIDGTINNLKNRFPAFEHVIRFLEHYKHLINLVNPNIEDFISTQKLIGHRKDAPFTHVNHLNELIIKGNGMTGSNLSDATRTILEVARYINNRTENMKMNQLNTFRNKISGKAKINMKLMCDNQTDRNGNFLWGTREYHARRFFNNFFTEIDPEQGYDEFVIRKGPNGSRKLAIANLIISTNEEALRAQINGEPIDPEPLSQACISKMNDAYMYANCCVTLENGKPALSEIKPPTKNHVVVGNTGDSKYVDLPILKEKMYIAKEGYCYVNIFLAMMINIDENKAKDFTKTVRDIVIPKLGKWPRMQSVATYCFMLRTLYPDVHDAELPRILVDHKTKTMHVIDSFGSLTTGYHILKASTVSQLISFAHDALDSEMKFYQVGGDSPFKDAEKKCSEYIKILVKGIFKPLILKQVLEEEPYILMMAVVSPKILQTLYENDSFDWAMKHLVNKDMPATNIIGYLKTLARSVSMVSILHEQFMMIDSHAGILLEELRKAPDNSFSYRFAVQIVETMRDRAEMDEKILSIGFRTAGWEARETLESTYSELIKDAWRELTLRERLQLTWRSPKARKNYTIKAIQKKCGGFEGAFIPSPTILVGTLITHTKVKACSMVEKCYKRSVEILGTSIRKSITSSLNIVRFLAPDLFNFINTVVAISLLLTVFRQIRVFLEDHKRAKSWKAHREWCDMERRLDTVYRHICRMKENKELPTEEEFETFLEEEHPELKKHWDSRLNVNQVKWQAKHQDQRSFEKVIAIVTLIMMVFDTDRSDCVYKSLSKLRNLTTICGDDVKFQSLDDIQDEFSESNSVIHVELDDQYNPQSECMDKTFREWFNNQINNSNTITHYRTEGYFMEFTRATAAEVANKIAHGTHKDILLRGAVGSGKSTGLPSYLSQKGKVLMVQPTKPLVQNVYHQLQGAPFYKNATMRIRGESHFGNDPITIMTSGFALHYYAHNIQQLLDFEFVIFDECHVFDASAMAFRCLLKEYAFNGKIIKSSATPPGRESDFTTQYPVEVVENTKMDFESFVNSLGTAAAIDITQKCDNILVYVASYREVDDLAQRLQTKGYKVTKVDGRSMKNGKAAIETHGTKDQKHFIVATNIIENGVTLDIDGVVDFGKKVSPMLNADMRCVSYCSHPISYGERIQRMGRVGRHKRGFVVKAGWTEKGLVDVPEMIATEAALLCFAYGLPVMTAKVNTNVLDSCTTRQVRTMLNFELSPFYTAHLVRFDGTMHPAIHSILKKFKLRDSEIKMNNFAIPTASAANWYTARQYIQFGCRTNIENDVKIAFYINDVPDAIHEQIHMAVIAHAHDSSYGTIKTLNAAKVAYTLQTDPTSIQRTVRLLEELMALERQKQAHLQTALSNPCLPAFATLSTLMNSVRARHSVDFTAENIAKLQAARDSILEFRNLTEHFDYAATEKQSLQTLVKDYGAVEAVRFQNHKELSNFLKLKGHWNKPLIVKDIIVLIAILGGGCWMLYNYFVEKWNEPVHFQGKGKRQSQKLKFRTARDNKMAREIHGDEAAEYFFGEAYNEKKGQKGKMKSMGLKKRPFVNMYGFDPADFSAIRFIDPITGHTLDESPHCDISIVQSDFFRRRNEALMNDEIDAQHMEAGIQAYIMRHASKEALQIDMTPHNPFRLNDNGVGIAGYAERKGELRQTGKIRIVKAEDVPKANPMHDEVEFEAKSLFRGLRDYNPISSVICQLRNEVGEHCSTIYGIGYGACIITNKHLFRSGAGRLKIQSRHGEFHIENAEKLQIQPCEGRDMIIIKTPKDFPPFPQKIKFRYPISGESVCMVGSLFQNKSISSTISQSSVTEPRDDGSLFWRHWIDTQDGYCGLPLVSVKDGSIVGIHSLESMKHSHNYYTSMPDDFEKKYLKTIDLNKWISNWKFNINDICWGSMNIEKDLPEQPFRISKLVSDLFDEPVRVQCQTNGWMFEQLTGNLKAVAYAPSQLVTKHTVKGKCQLFDLYLATHPDESKYFKQYMGQYAPSALNRESYIKDIMKYSTPIHIGNVDTNVFEKSIPTLIRKMRKLGFVECEYVTDSATILASMNMKSAVGALYSGKKKDYFSEMTPEEVEEIVQASCLRLYQGRKGIWNGSIKAELRPIQKVFENKTRTFTAAPLDTLLGGKVCVDDFNNQFYSLNIIAPWTVGMTKFSLGWNLLLESLPEGWLYCDADGSRFDSSLSPYLINAVLKIRLAFMESWSVGEQMLANLYAEIIYTPILTADGTIVKKFKGNNSGQPSTVVDNTLMVILAMIYSLEKLGYNGTQQDDICRYFANGDDLIIAVHPKHTHILDGLQQHFSDLGLTYDFSSRTNEKGELWFMSHHGVKRDGFFIPKLEKERIVSILEWDRSEEPAHRLEAICASMIEAWGYDDLLREIRKFYSWVLEQAPYSQLAKTGKAPYIAETALKRLYMDIDATEEELRPYIDSFEQFLHMDSEVDSVRFQADDKVFNAGVEDEKAKEKEQDKAKDKEKLKESTTSSETQSDKPKNPDQIDRSRDRDVNVGSIGTFSVPRIKKIASQMRVPTLKGKSTMNLQHLLEYKPRQEELSNKRATDSQLQTWYDGVKNAYEVDDNAMQIIINGLVVWCIENGTSQNLNGMWIMMDGEEQVEYPIKPLLDHARPTFRQIMTRYSDVAEAYIEMRNSTEPYMPRYGLQRNLTDRSLARYAFDFYEMKPNTSARAKEALTQMKAAAVRGSANRLFGLDGNVGTSSEDTERHTAEDSTQRVHNLGGVQFL